MNENHTVNKINNVFFCCILIFYKRTILLSFYHFISKKLNLVRTAKNNSGTTYQTNDDTKHTRQINKICVPLTDANVLFRKSYSLGWTGWVEFLCGFSLFYPHFVFVCVSIPFLFMLLSWKTAIKSNEIGSFCEFYF